MKYLFNLGKGKLTYTMAAVGVIWSIFALLSGVVDQDQAVGVLWASLALFGVRRALP